MVDRIHGVWCATLTPLDSAGAPAYASLAAHVTRLFAAGIDGIALFGTTGEGQSFSLSERRAGLDALLSAGVAPERVLPGTGCAALTEAIELTRHAVRAGCAGALASCRRSFSRRQRRGIYASYARLIDGVADARLRLYLYHIRRSPECRSRTTSSPRLAAVYPKYWPASRTAKGVLDHTRRLLARFRELAIFVGFEPDLPAALAAGGAGTISGIANLYPRLMRRLHDDALKSDYQEDLTRVEAFIAQLERYPLFAAFKALLAELSRDRGWEALRPPLVPLDATARRAWLAAVAKTGIVPERDAAVFD
jgi:4-hydroxy-tetrahydrodipicolinate synthase